MAAATDEPPAAAMPPAAALPPGSYRLLRDGGRPLAMLLALALVLKLLVLAVTLEESPLGSWISSDARYYVDRARGLAGIDDDPRLHEVYHLPPLYPALLSVLPGVVEGHYASAMALQALAGVVLLGCVFLWTRRRASRRAALLALLLTLAYAPLTYFETRLLGDQLATVLLIVALVAADALFDRPGGWRGAWLGLLLGLTCLARPQALLLLPLMALWALRLRRSAGLALVLAAALPLLPVVWHNAQASGQLVLVSDNGGINLWLANSGPPSGTFLTYDKEFGNIGTQADVARRRAQLAVGRTLTPAEVSRWYGRQALSSILDDPALFARRVWLRARALLETFETGVVVIPEVEMALVPPLRLLPLPFGALLACWSAGLVLLLATRRQGCTPPSRIAPRLPALAVAGMVVLTTLLFYHYSRFRLPLVPLMAAGVGLGLDRLRAQRPSAAVLALALTVAGLAAWISWQPNDHQPGVLANGWTVLAEARRALAGPRDTAGQEQALEDVTRALESDPGFVRAQLLAAELALALERFDLAARQLERVESALHDDPSALFLRGVLSLDRHPANRHRDPEQAAAILEQLRLMAVGDPSLAGMLGTLERLDELSPGPR